LFSFPLRILLLSLAVLSQLHGQHAEKSQKGESGGAFGRNPASEGVKSC
jgi:hypothetical protein